MECRRSPGKERQRLPVSSPQCPQHRDLLQEYLDGLEAVRTVSREYQEMITYGNDWGAMRLLKAKLDERKEALRDARHRYAEHKREHGC